VFKGRTPEAILLTVPYTGTHFTRMLLELVDARAQLFGKAYVPTAHWLDENIAEDWDKIMQTKVLVTARDPYLSAIRSIKTGQENPVAFIADAWDVCFTAMDKMNYFIFDIGCAKQDRLSHAQNAIKFISIDLDLGQIDDYIDDWTPENESVSEHKTKYLETGELPEGYDWSMLDSAVDWYKLLTTHA
jgi:hypothetical protein